MLGAYHGKKYWQNQRTQKAMDITHEQKLAEIHGDSEQVLAEMGHTHDEKTATISENAATLAAKFTALEAKVRDLGSPERLEALRKMAGR